MGLKNDVAFVAVALLLAYGIYQTVGLALGTQVPVVAVTSGSMEPNLHRGDMIVVEGEPWEEIEVGEIIVFESGDMPVPVIHRVIEKNETALQTQGDALNTQHEFEKHITEDQVMGTALFSIPMIGHVKLVPTCFYLQIQRNNVPPTIC
ncbi:MAG: signal peptidase I [Candidatus Nanohaloarchaeota archaeon QJJ-7]|nr:signal peptidase I [Candidatus Nanohaloarchaeota archaeon QJJ-7]